MQDYKQVLPGLEVNKRWYDTDELTPGIYKIVEKVIARDMDDEDYVSPIMYSYRGCYWLELSDYAKVYNSVYEDSTVLIVPDYDYNDRINYHNLMDKTQTLIKVLDECDVSWIHISKDYTETRNSFQSFIQYGNADVARCSQSLLSSLAPSSLFVFNEVFKYAKSWWR